LDPTPEATVVQIRTLAVTDEASAARLLIYTDTEAQGEAQERPLAALVRRLGIWLAPCPRRDPPLSALEIHDLRGQRILAVREPSPLVEVVLPPGTYHVSARVEGKHRRYTVMLEAGASLDLRLSTTRESGAG
jgi:hypothetical protein